MQTLEQINKDFINFKKDVQSTNQRIYNLLKFMRGDRSVLGKCEEKTEPMPSGILHEISNQTNELSILMESQRESLYELEVLLRGEQSEPNCTLNG